MEDGLAYQMTYGEGGGQNTKHAYAGTISNEKRKSVLCRKPKKKKKVVKRI